MEEKQYQINISSPPDESKPKKAKQQKPINDELWLEQIDLKLDAILSALYQGAGTKK